MKTIKVLQALGPIDILSVRRDPLLRWMVFYPLMIAALIRWGFPLLAGRLAAAYQFDLIPYLPLLMSFFLLIMPMLGGLVIGFLLLDQRDDRTLTALMVTPLSPTGYMAYRLAVPMLLSLVMTLLIFLIAGLAGIGLISLLIVSLGAAPLAPLYALALAAFAANKVQGFALTKALGILLVFPVLAWFVPVPWQLVFGLVPLYWPTKVFWLLYSGESNYWLYWLIGLIYQFMLMWLLIRRFNQVMHR